jgi:hypothetical protein
MQKSVTQSLSTVKPRVIWHLAAFKLGVEDGKAGATWADGYSLFCGPSYSQWRYGWEEGRKVAQRRQVTH